MTIRKLTPKAKISIFIYNKCDFIGFSAFAQRFYRAFHAAACAVKPR